MTTSEKQIKKGMLLRTETQEILPSRELEPELKDAKILNMEYIANQGTPLSAAQKSESSHITLSKDKELEGNI